MGGGEGAVVLLAGAGLLTLVHRDLQAIGERWVEQLHLNPASRSPRIFLQALGELSNQRLWLLALGALAYTSLRWAEAYGLWFHRRWAEWLAVLSGAIYLPIEVYGVAAGFSGLKLAVLVVNLAIVSYMSRVLWMRPIKV